MRKNIPEKTIQRLLVYYRYLLYFLQQGVKDLSSRSLADLLEIRDSQVRKDLSYLGCLGKRGSGYDILTLRDKLAEVLEIKREIKACVVGMGNLGAALAAYRGFEALGIKIVAVFDNFPQKIGRKIRGHLCLDISNISKEVKSRNIKLAILAVPAEAAQETAIKLEKSQIKGLLNFTPVKLSLSRSVKVRNVDLASELKTLSFFTGE
jgi:redox-sensing transcriptional repressor